MLDSWPTVAMASSISADQKLALSLMQFRYFFMEEKMGHGAIVMPSLSADSKSSTESTASGNSTHKTYPPEGWLTRVPSGKCLTTARAIS
ncbi:MAG: hypothetical protein HQL03_09790, partial [Nitrospirae bacterium]|nr:hypothetical protein [Nitrospirota bacterium]